MKDPETGRLSWPTQWPPCNHRVPSAPREAGEAESVRVTGRGRAAGLEEGGQGHTATDAEVPAGWKSKETASPLELPTGTPPCQYLDFRTFDLQNCKLINALLKTRNL